jgi:putative transposase
MFKHFSKRYKPALLNSHTVREILDRLDVTYKRFFKHDAKRPPKFKKMVEFSSFVFMDNGYSFSGNVLTINKIKKSFKFSLSRPYVGKVKRVTVKRNKLGEYFIVLCLDKQAEPYGKSRNGASVGIDFGLKKYMTLSDGREIDNPQFLKADLQELRRRSRNLSKCKKGSNNRKRKKMELERLYRDIVNKRSDFQWKLAHELCKRYDLICLEDLNLEGMKRNWGRKMSDLAHGDFVVKLEHVAKKYGVQVHKIDRFFPSSRLCTCGYKNDRLSLGDRIWTCPSCGAVHPRDLFAAENILRQGIAELGSGSKSPKHSQGRSHVSHPTIPCK